VSSVERGASPEILSSSQSHWSKDEVKEDITRKTGGGGMEAEILSGVEFADEGIKLQTGKHAWQTLL
jgi:hypothetical protein